MSRSGARYVQASTVGQPGGVAGPLTTDTVVPAAQLAKPGIYLPPDWGQFWKPKRALAQAGTGNARVVLEGDSIGRGYGSSNLDSKGFAALVAAQFTARVTGFQGAVDTNAGMTAAGVSSAFRTAYAAQQAAATGTWTIAGDATGPGGQLIFTNTAGSTVTFTRTGTSITVYYLQKSNSTATINWTIDGVAQTPINANNATTAVASVTVSGLSAGSHAVTFTHPTDTNFTQLYGVYASSATGFVFSNTSVYGSGTATCINGGFNFMAGANNPTDLLLYELGANDASAGTAGDTWAENTAKYLNAAKSATSGSTDIVLLMPHIVGSDNSVPHWPDYLIRARGLAEAYGAALIDFWTLGRNTKAYWQGLGYVSSDDGTGVAGSGIHPSDAGHQYMANQVIALLTA